MRHDFEALPAAFGHIGRLSLFGVLDIQTFEAETCDARR